MKNSIKLLNNENEAKKEFNRLIFKIKNDILGTSIYSYAKFMNKKL
ncbi:MAG: hypothetical protein NC313_09910 [Butyrivibrio sp.]|nr:hypothetical protein [Butyrivibrio sp.]